eukprot:gene12940-17236_t
MSSSPASAPILPHYLSLKSLISQKMRISSARKNLSAPRRYWRSTLASLPLFLLAAAAPAADTSPAVTPYDAVDPFIGTGGEGHTYPGAVAPFGMVQLSPDTDTTCVIRACYSHAAGYRYEDPTIQGFSHTHFSGAGHSDLGDILVMPAIGDDATVPLEPGDAKAPGAGYRRCSATLTAGKKLALLRSASSQLSEEFMIGSLTTSLASQFPSNIKSAAIPLE